MKIRTEHIISAIIGYWRSGASLEEIKSIFNIRISVLEEIINKVK